jgi:hypothetical protein
MTRTRKIQLMIAFLGLMFSCAEKPEKLRVDDYAKWIVAEEHGFIKKSNLERLI